MGSDYEKLDDKGQPLDRAGVLVVWEAYEAKTMRQIKLVEENAPGHLETHGSVRQMIHNGEFMDGTCVSKTEQMGEGGAEDSSNRGAVVETTPYTPDLEAQPNPDYFSMSVPKGSMETLTMGGTHPVDSLRLHTNNFFTENQRRPTDTSEPSLPVHEEEEKSTGHVLSRIRTFTVTGTAAASQSKQVFEILLPGFSQTVRLSCPKPPSLKVLLSELQDNTSLSDNECRLEYTKSPGEIVKLQTQKQLDYYMTLPKKPQLFVAVPRTNGTK